MVNRIEEQFIMFPFEYISPVEVTVEESLTATTGTAIIHGTLLREGVSRNGNLYTIDEMKKIAGQAEGIPLYVGTMIKRNPNTGRIQTGMHANIEKNRVGRIIKTVFDEAKRVIKFWAELVNTKEHPHIIEEVRKGWGVSIGGIAHKAKIVINEAGEILRKILGMVLNHVQLLPPDKITGVVGTEIESIEVQESMIIYCDDETGACYTNTGEVVKSKPKPVKISLDFKF